MDLGIAGDFLYDKSDTSNKTIKKINYLKIVIGPLGNPIKEIKINFYFILFRK